MLTYIPLSLENLEEAISLVRDVFPDDFNTADSPEEAYRASLDREGHKEFINRYHLGVLQYFIVKDAGTNKTIGVTGWYVETTDSPGIIWLGWYCVESGSRRKGFGKEILEWTIDQARNMGYKTMRLYTSTHPNEVAAQSLYEKVGLKLYDKKEAEDDGYVVLFREKEL